MYNVRAATVEDVDKIYSLIYDSVHELCRQHYTPEKLNSFIKNLPSKVTYYKWLTDRILIVCCNEGDVIGFGQYDPAESFIDAIYVHPQHTNKGVGSSIMKYLEEVARTLKKNQININGSINATRFYAKCGYEEQGTFFISCKDGTRFETVRFYKLLNIENA